MKTRIYASFSLSLAFSTLSLLTGCAEPATDQPGSLIGSANAEPPPAAISTNTLVPNPAPPAAETEVAAAEVAEVNVPEPAPASALEKQLPASIKPTPPTAEVIKLAQAGVDKAVLLNYITNTRSLFVLSSDDIIYLNDLGVDGNIVTAMMQHDQGLKANWSNPIAQPPPATEQAAAPTYVNPPPAESQPQAQPQPQPESAPVAVAPPPANVAYFNASLAPYGTWVEVEGYGRCWQPTVVVGNSGWRPYSDRGRWIYTDAGWYWMSDYSWGATTFHYGRWLSHPRWGWCWWPDNVWAPSWVSWRYSGDYCGWAPLPPAAYYRSGVGFSYYGSSVGVNFGFGLGASCFTFVSWGHFRDPHPYHYRVASHQVTQIYNHTTIVNNYGRGRNNTVVNHGIPADRVREHTRTELRPVSLRDHTVSAGLGRGERLERDGRSLVVNRPRIPESAAAKPLTTPPLHTETAGERGRNSRATTGISAPNNTHTSPAPTGTPRGNGRDSQTEVGRERNNRPGPTAPPPSGTTVTARTAPAAPSTATSPPVRPTRGGPSSAPASSQVFIGKRDPNSNSSNPGRPNSTASVPGSSSVTKPASPPAPMTPSQGNPSVQRSPQNHSTSTGGTTRSESPAPRGSSAPSYSPRPTQTYSAPSRTSAQPTQRTTTSESNRPQNSQSSFASRSAPLPPTYSGPALTPSPSYTPRPSPAPSSGGQRSAPTAAAPSYTPRSAPAGPAPAVSAPRSAPVESRSAPSSNARPESGGRNRP